MTVFGITNASNEKMTALTKGIHSSLLPLRSGGWIESGMAVNVGKRALLLAGWNHGNVVVFMQHISCLFWKGSKWGWFTLVLPVHDSLDSPVVFTRQFHSNTDDQCAKTISGAYYWVHGGHRRVLLGGMYCTIHVVKTAKCCFLILIATIVPSDFIWVHPACAFIGHLSLQLLF